MVQSLLIDGGGKISLERFVLEMESIIDCKGWEERQSDNYVGGRYFSCQILGLDLTLSVGDDSAFPQYDFSLSCDIAAPFRREGDFLRALADYLARSIAAVGHVVLRPDDDSRAGAATTYRLDPSAGPRADLLIHRIASGGQE
jgi:hypothetical protein